jgi:hypothetical protein
MIVDVEKPESAAGVLRMTVPAATDSAPRPKTAEFSCEVRR